MNERSLSTQGQTAISNPIRADFDFFYEVMEDRYDVAENPNGKIPLCIAENVLGWHGLSARLSELTDGKAPPEWVAGYTSTQGHPDFRAALASFLTRHIGGNALDPECMAVSAGATAVIETTAFLLGDPGDYAVIPGPAYSVYSGDIGNRAGLKRYDLPLPHTSGTHPGVYELDTRELDKAYEELGDKFKLLILTQPNNPTGQVYTEDDIFKAVTWCEERKIHCAVNEIYAFSLIDQTHPELAGDYENRQWFVSCLSQLEARNSDFFHWWYSFSKDFGVSGLRIGALYSKNEALIKAYANYSAPVTTSNHTQWMLTQLLLDDEWVMNWMREERNITASYVLVVKALRQLNVRYLPAVGSLFVWFDLSAYLTEDTDAAWEELWRDLYRATGVLLTYPLGMGGTRRGWMRMVYSCVTPATLEVALARIGDYLRERQ